MKRTLFILAISAVAVGAQAQQIGSRAALNALLVGSTSDDFEAFSIGVGNATNLDTTTLDSTTIANGQGPGLVNAGATYSDPSGTQLQWNGDTYFGINTKTLLSNGSGGQIRIDYAGATQAMGLDAKVFNGFGYSGMMQVYNGATLVDTVNFNLAGTAGESVFLGYQNNAGISHVIVSDLSHSWSAIIDDHTYGVVPEPATMIALGLGLAALARRRRK
ncbi:MAG: PEP-CTERM sorting domain-containing protein [Fimbriimonadaceae bacterium]